jgi:shikimate dehydrogenase
MKSWRMGLIGRPVGHSLSACMHEAAFAALGLDGTYSLVDTPEDEVPVRVDELRRGEVDGWNVTLPWKRRVLEFADELDDAVAEIGAANVLTRTSRGVVAHNTDVDGFRETLRRFLGSEPIGHVVVLGAGGAARAAAWVLSEGADSVTVINRHVSAARELAADIVSAERAGPAPFSALPWPRTTESRRDVAERLRECDLLVHATSQMDTETSVWRGFAWPRLADGVRIVDLVYGSEPSVFVRLAKSRSLRCVDGRTMLLFQAARAFTLWTGHEAPVVAMAEALATALGCSVEEVLLGGA